MELIHGNFGKLRDLESGFHDKIMTLAMQEMLKFNKNELEYELSEEAKAVLKLNIKVDFFFCSYLEIKNFLQILLTLHMMLSHFK